MLSNEIIFFAFLSYLTGAIPSAVWLGKIFYKVDVREFGSGNEGATNTFRVLGKGAGIPVLLIDIIKGWMAVNYVCLLHNTTELSIVNPNLYFEIKLAFGIFAVIGHLFPVYIGFRGGKGIATMLGLLIGLHPLAALYTLLVFILIFIFFKYVSLASIIASFTFPLIIIFFLSIDIYSLQLFSIFVPILSLITHQKNIERLVRGEETKVNFDKK